MAVDFAQDGMCQLEAFEGDGASESESGELGMRIGEEEGEGEGEGCATRRPMLLRAAAPQLLRFTALTAGACGGEAARDKEACSALVVAAGELGEAMNASADNERPHA
jgi:hypothetical protein